MNRAVRGGMAALLAVALPACNKAPAREALEEAEQALAAAPEIAAYLPDEQAALAAVVKNARVAYDEGRYTDALRAALPLGDRIAAARTRAESQQQELAARWSTLGRDVSGRLEAVVERLGVLVAGGWIASERQAAAEAEIVAINEAWSNASALASAGQVAKAVTEAEAVGERVDALARALAPRRAPAPSAAPTPAPDPTPTPEPSEPPR